MTDKKNDLGLEDLDWDAAIEEWENSTLVPETARDKETNRLATLNHTPPPPMAVPPAAPSSARTLLKPPSLAPVLPPTEPALLVEDDSEEIDNRDNETEDVDDEGSRTVVAEVPAELMRQTSEAPSGLGQLFKGRSVEPKNDDVFNVLFEEPKQSRFASEPPMMVTEDDLATTLGDPDEEETPEKQGPQSGATQVMPDAGVALFEDLPGPDEDEGDEPTSEAIRPRPPPPPISVSALAPRPAPAPLAPAPPLHVPTAREHDPNEETGIVSRDHVTKVQAEIAAAIAAQADPSGRPQPPRSTDDEAPTRLRPRMDSVRSPDSIPVALPPAQTFDQERPAAEWLDDARRDEYVLRAAFLESEARATPDPRVCARGLLAVSELHAIVGDFEAAERYALEARELASGLPLVHWQARGLMPVPPDTTFMVDVLDAEIQVALAPAAKLHALLLSAEHLRLVGDDEGVAARWGEACRTAPDDVRAQTMRAAKALALGDHAHPGLRFSDAPSLASISLGVGTALRMRGVERTDSDAGEILANDSLRRARAALERGDLPAAATLIAELRSVPELSRGAAWLAAALAGARPETRVNAAQWLKQLVGTGDALARRALCARGLELGDAEMIEAATTGDETFSPAERGVLAALTKPPTVQSEGELHAISAMDGMAPLAAALGAISYPSAPEELVTRAGHVAGSEPTRALMRLGRLLAGDAPSTDIETAIENVARDMPDSVRALTLEMALRSGRFDEVASGLGTWADAYEGDKTAPRDRQLAAALVAERAGDKARALAEYRAAKHADPTCDPALRAIAELDPSTDLVHELNALSDDLGDGVRGAIARMEAIIRAGSLDDTARSELLHRAHVACRELPFAAFMAERIARNAGNADEVLAWVRERRAATTDPIESALDAVREALLVADREPEVASARLSEAHFARPEDFALRELLERLATDPLNDRAAWREQRALAASGPSRALLFTEAAHEYERASDNASAMRAAQAARAGGDEGFARLALERTEILGGGAARLADELLTQARTTENARERRESYERLADLDAARGEPASALLWHKTILEDDPSHKPSLRFVEHVLLGEGRDRELEPFASFIAHALKGSAGAECGAHVELASRWRVRAEEGSDSIRDLVEIGAAQPEPSLWALRMANAQARARRDDTAVLASTLALVLRSSRSQELAALNLRAGEAAARLEDLDLARTLLERSAAEDSGDVVTWGLLAEVRQRTNDGRGAAEAGESLARTSGVPHHQLLAWYDSARLWLDMGEEDRAVSCLESAAALDVTYLDVFDRLSTLYGERGARQELASLLERRLEKVTDPDQRVTMEVERGRALTDIKDHDAARLALESALAARPDHTGALSAFGDLCAGLGDWDAAETAWVRLARALNTPEEQRSVYARLGDLYAVHAVNLARAEVAFREVLKRAPDDPTTLERLVDVYKRQNDPARAVETQQQLIALATEPTPEPAQRRKRLVQLAMIYDETGHEPRKAEQTLEAARREFPGDVTILRALADFYARHKQGPAVNILLDRAAADARRAFVAGRFTPGHFEVLAAVFDIRGKKDAARIVAATLNAFEGRPATLRGADARACDPRLDDLLAPEVLTDALRALLVRTGDALDAASPLDLRALRATALPQTAATIHAQIQELAKGMGMGQVQIMVSPQIGRTCVPCSSSPPTIVLGEALLSAPSEIARTFLVTRALKLVHARASALVRTPAAELAVVIAAWLQLFNPSWTPQGIPHAALAEAARRLQSGLPKNLGDDVGVIALDVAGSLGTQGATLGANAISWANRTALLSVGDPNAAMDAIAWSLGAKDGAPSDAEERGAWCSRTLEIKDLVAFTVTEAYAEARSRIGLDK